MTVTVALKALVSAIEAFDQEELAHQNDVLRWLGATDDVFRRVPPRTPPKHVVSYFLLRDPADGSVLLVDHRKARLWLPTGGHVDPGEHPAATVRREALEELGIEAEFASVTSAPDFITVTDTTGDDEHRHTDVSLWFLLVGSRALTLSPDPREFVSARWWAPAEVSSADPTSLEPHLDRFLSKMADRYPMSASVT